MIDSLRRVLEYAIGYLDIVPDSASTDADIAAIAQMIAAYDALAPDWSQAPEGATHFVINAEGYGEWLFGVEPRHQVAIIGAKWSKQHVWSTEPVGHIDIPIGVDWRLLKWQRPEVAA